MRHVIQIGIFFDAPGSIVSHVTQLHAAINESLLPVMDEAEKRMGIFFVPPIRISVFEEPREWK